MSKPNQETFSPTNMSTQIIKSTSESTTPKATKTQIVEALTKKEYDERIKHNSVMDKRRKEIDKEIHKSAISNLVGKKEEELSSCRTSNWYGRCRIELEISNDEIEALFKEREKLRNKPTILSEIKKEIKALMENQINVKENPLLRPENDKNLEILLSILKSPLQHNLEIK